MKFSGQGLCIAFRISKQAANVCQGSSESSHHDDSTFSNGWLAEERIWSMFSFANWSLELNNFKLENSLTFTTIYALQTEKEYKTIYVNGKTDLCYKKKFK